MAVENTPASGNALNNLFVAIKPWLPLILVVALIVIILILTWGSIKKFFGKPFQRDFDKEKFKQKVSELAREPARAPSWAKHVIFSFGIASACLSLLVVAGLWLINFWKHPNWILPLYISVLVMLVVWLVSRRFPDKFSSRPRILTNTAEIIGFQASRPHKTADGWLEILVFEGYRWLLFSKFSILCIPLSAKIAYPSLDGKKKEKFSCKTPASSRWGFLGNGDIRINAPDFFRTKFYIYPLLNEKGDFENFAEIVFLREKYEGDILSMVDLANSARENALILAGSNPTVRLENAQTQKDSEQG